MLTKRIIPCLDVAAGRVVKGVNFVNLRDAGDPVELAAFYNSEEADEIVFLDITASFENRATMLDVVRRTAEQVFIHGGRTPTGIDVLEWARQGVALGAGEILLTSMDRDGTQLGYELVLNALVSETVPVPVIASGGVGRLEHFYEGLTVGSADALLAASIFHFGQLRICDVKEYLQTRGVKVRPC